MGKLMVMLCMLVGAVWVYMGFEYGFWVGETPGGGFMPIIFGGLTIVFSLILLFKNQEKSVTINKHVWLPIVVIAAVMGAIEILGMNLTLLLMVFGWLKFYEKYTTVRSGLIAITVGIFVFGIFGMWLQVPFPTGLIGI